MNNSASRPVIKLPILRKARKDQFPSISVELLPTDLQQEIKNFGVAWHIHVVWFSPSQGKVFQAVFGRIPFPDFMYNLPSDALFVNRLPRVMQDNADHGDEA